MYYFVVNPVSGNKRAKKAMKKIIKKVLDKSDISHSIIYTTKEDGARKVASILSNPQLSSQFDQTAPKKVIVVGGDGTYSEFLDGIVDFDSIDVGLIPAGRGNDFARTLNLSRNPVKEFKKIMHSKRVRYTDYIQVGDRRCMNVGGTGLDVDALAMVAAMKHSSKISYLIALKRILKDFKPYPIEVEVNGQTLKRDALIVSVCNGKYFGGGMCISPNSSPFDGKIHLILISMPDGNIWKILPSFLTGKHIGMPFVEEIVCESVNIKSLSLGHPAQTDGEISKDLKLNCSIAKGKLRLIN